MWGCSESAVCFLEQNSGLQKVLLILIVIALRAYGHGRASIYAIIPKRRFDDYETVLAKLYLCANEAIKAEIFKLKIATALWAARFCFISSENVKNDIYAGDGSIQDVEEFLLSWPNMQRSQFILHSQRTLKGLQFL